VIFSDYIAARSIAIVGPAPPVGDQRAEVDAHDLVYRIGGHVLVDLYTDRCDMVFLNGETGRVLLDDGAGKLRAKCDQADWWILKGRGFRPHGHYRSAFRPALGNPNAVTNMLFDLLAFDPHYITVFGADLYAGGPGTAYSTDSLKMRTASGVERSDDRIARGVMAHRPLEQRRLHRWAVQTGKVRGDDRYMAAVNMADDEYTARIADWARHVPPVETHA